MGKGYGGRGAPKPPYHIKVRRGREQTSYTSALDPKSTLCIFPFLSLIRLSLGCLSDQSESAVLVLEGLTSLAVLVLRVPNSCQVPHGNLLTPDDGDLVDLVDVPSAKELVGPVHKRIQVVEAHPRGLRSIHILPVPASVLQHPLSQGAQPQQSSDR